MVVISTLFAIVGSLKQAKEVVIVVNRMLLRIQTFLSHRGTIFDGLNSTYLYRTSLSLTEWVDLPEHAGGALAIGSPQWFSPALAPEGNKLVLIFIVVCIDMQQDQALRLGQS